MRILTLLLMLSCSCFASSGARLKICNTGKTTFLVFRITPVRNGVFSSDTWHIEAWWAIKAGECSTFSAQETHYSHNYSNSFFGFAVKVNGIPEAMVPVKAVRGALIRHIYGNSDVTDRFGFTKETEAFHVCVARTEVTDYEVETKDLSMTACKSQAELLLAAVEFHPFPIDTNDEKEFEIDVNVESELNIK